MNSYKAPTTGKKKETYRKPLLSNYGSIARLTRTSGGNQVDSGGAKFNHQAPGTGSGPAG